MAAFPCVDLPPKQRHYSGATRGAHCASDLQLIERAAHVALIAIQSDRSQTALQRAYQEIKQSEGRLRKIIDTSPTSLSL